MKKLISMILAITLMASLFIMPVVAEEPVFTDMPDDWTTSALKNAVKNGLLNGYDGKIMPNDNIKRSEMAAILVRAFGATKEADLSKFKDVPKSEWYYPEFARAVEMKIFNGSDNGMMYPENDITFQECFAVISRLVSLPDMEANRIARYSDAKNIDDWAKQSVANVIFGGYWEVKGGKIRPQEYITRAEFAVLMDNLIKTYITEPGTYTTLPEGNTVIKAANVVIDGVKTDDMIIVSDGIAGDVKFINMDMEGTVLARGGNVTVEGNVYRLLAPTSYVSLDSAKWVKTPVITNYYQDKKAAMTITMDDGYYKSAVLYDRIFKKYGLKGTANIVSNKLENVSGWKEILAGGRIDVGNHSASHDIYYGSGESRQQLVTDITDAYSALKGTFPDQNILAFAAPYGRNSAEATEVMKEKHFANRAAGSSSSNNPDPTENEWMNLGTFMYSNTKLETMNGWVDDALGSGKWGIELYHGILGVDNMSSDLGVDETLFDNHMAYLASKKNDIWNGTLNEVVAYIRERQNANISTILSEDGSTISVSITDNLPNDKFFHPLTVKVYLPGGWDGSVKCGDKTVSAKTDEFGKYVMVEIVPDKGEVTLTK